MLLCMQAGLSLLWLESISSGRLCSKDPIWHTDPINQKMWKIGLRLWSFFLFYSKPSKIMVPSEPPFPFFLFPFFFLFLFFLFSFPFSFFFFSLLVSCLCSWKQELKRGDVKDFFFSSRLLDPLLLCKEASWLLTLENFPGSHFYHPRLQDITKFERGKPNKTKEKGSRIKVQIS